jgi:MYXO-CTERM domain-containing protein
MKTVSRFATGSEAGAWKKTALRWIGVAGVLLGTLIAFETRALACLTSLQCSGSTPICNVVSMMCQPCANDLECIARLSGTVCVLTGPMAGQCVASVSDAGSDADAAEASTDGSGADSAADSGQDSAGNISDAPPDTASGGDGGGPDAADGSGGEAGEEDAPADGVVAPSDGAVDSGFDSAGGVETSTDSAPEDSAVARDTGAAADASLGDAPSRDGNGTPMPEANEGAAPPDAPSAPQDTSLGSDDALVIEGGGCSCHASPEPAIPRGMVAVFFGLALFRWRRPRR